MYENPITGPYLSFHAYVAFHDDPSVNKLPIAKRWDKFNEIAEHFLDRTVFTICGSGTMETAMKGFREQSLEDAIREGFLKPMSSDKHIHRVAIFSPEDGLEQILSQSDIIRFFARYTHVLGQKAQMTVAELGRYLE